MSFQIIISFMLSLLPMHYESGHYTQKDFDKLVPLTGQWVAKRENGDIFETWELRNPTELTGRSFKVVQKDTTFLETMRLYLTNGDIVYAPTAAGQNDEKPVLFALKSMADDVFVFENPKHDFPVRIVYNLQSKDAVLAYVEGKMNGKTHRIEYPYIRK